MAKVIEFYIPTNFRKPLRSSPQPQLGKIIEFCRGRRDQLSLLPNFCGLRGNMTFIPTQTGFMRLQDSEKLLRAIFPNYPSLAPRHSAPRLEKTVRTTLQV